MSAHKRGLLIALALSLSVLLVLCLAAAGIVYYAYRLPESNAGPSVSGQYAGPVPTNRVRAQQLVLPAFGEPLTLDPHLVQDADSAEYTANIFSGLVGITNDLKLEADIAERWDMSADGRVYTFYLRRDVTFQDGRPLTAADVIYSLERALDPATKSPTAGAYLGDIVGAAEKLGGQAATVAGLKAPDDYTVQITIDAPKSYFLWQLTYHCAYIVDRANVESGSDWQDRPNGSGPFQLTKKTDTEIVLERNDRYYGKMPRLQQVRYLLDGGDVNRYEESEVDLTQVGGPDIERVTDYRDPLNKQLSVTDMFSFSYIGLDTNVPPFDDAKVRQALSLAIDKDKLSQVVMKDMVAPAYGILPPGLPGHNPSLKPLAFDPALARQTLAQSRYAGKMPAITFYLAGSGGAARGVPAAIQEMVSQNLGVKIDIQRVDSAAFFSGLHQHRYGMFITGWIADYPDPYNFLDVLFYSGSGLNQTNYQNGQLDQVLRAARIEHDEAKRTQLYQQAEQIIVNDAPVIPLSYARDYWLIKPYVKGVQRPPLVLPWLRDVYMEAP